MKQKADRKNFHKEHIFTLEQNKLDFDYIKDHRGKSEEATSTKNRIKRAVKKSEKLPDIDFGRYINMVEEKAYGLYEKNGCCHGHDLEDWFEAQKLVEDELYAAQRGLI